MQDYVDKYASLLNGRDVTILFNHLKEITSRSEAARLCDLERRTTFYWNDDREVRLFTKQKLLLAILEKDFLFTLRYLCERAFEVSSQTISLYLETLYENAMDPDLNSTEFEKLASEFRAIRIKYSPIINTTMTPTISYIFENLKKRSADLRIDFPSLPLSTMAGKDVVDILPHLIKRVPMSLNNNDLDQFAENFNINRELIKFASDIKIELFSTFPKHLALIEDSAYNPYQLQVEKSTLSNASPVKYGRRDLFENQEEQIAVTNELTPPMIEDYVIAGGQ
jgi:hypothetical protein